MTQAVPRLLDNPEACVNLWAYADDDGYIARIAARAYALCGSDDAKLATPHQLAASDFLHAVWQGVSKQFVIECGEGQRMQGIAHASMLNDEVTPGVLFAPLFDQLATQVPEQARTVNGQYETFRLELPDDPLTVTTVVMELDNGQLVPVAAP